MPVTAATVRRAYGIASALYAPGLTTDDIAQEALLGALKARRDYRPEAGPFGPFEQLCMERQAFTAVKLARRLKHGPINDSLRAKVTEEGDVLDPVDLVYHPTSIDTLERVIDRENVVELAVRLATLSPFERVCVCGFANGLTYEQMGAKTADNALHRARKKLAA